MIYREILDHERNNYFYKVLTLESRSTSKKNSLLHLIFAIETSYGG